MKVLVTGFSPFGGETMNPALEAVRKLPDTIGSAEIVKAELPVVFDKGALVLEELINAHRPEIVISVGQAGGSPAISVERVAINLQDARIPDNEGNAPVDKTIKSDGKAAYFSTLPTRAMVQVLREQGIPAVLSYSAGTYVCNDVMYHLLYWIEKRWRDMRGGFIHVPYCLDQAASKTSPPPSMALDSIARALEISIRTALKHGHEAWGRFFCFQVRSGIACSTDSYGRSGHGDAENIEAQAHRISGNSRLGSVPAPPVGR